MDPAASIDAVWRAESRRVFATLVRLLGDFDLAEEALSAAFAAALERWPRDGVPARPRPWLVSVGRHQALDALRRRARFDARLAELAARHALAGEGDAGAAGIASDRDRERAGEREGEGEPEDDRLRLVFACCHPALALDAQVALTLREVCGLTTEAIARSFLVAPATLAQRIVRAKARLRELGLEPAVPAAAELPPRLDGVLRVVYLVFHEGWAPSAGASAVRGELCEEGVRLARLLAGLLPEPEVLGLLALLLLLEARRPARVDERGDLVLLEDQDRSRWSGALIAEGSALVERALRSRRFGSYTLQAAIAAVHAEAPNTAATDWAQITGLYDLLLRVDPSPVVELNRAVAVAMRDGPAAGLREVDALVQRGALAGYAPLYAVRADLCRRLGRAADARQAYDRALQATRLEPERRLLQRRRDGLGAQ